jgi:hypothetical protein
VSSESPSDLENIRQWIADAAAREAVDARVRSRRLLQQASEDATFIGTLVDLAERDAELNIVTSGDASIAGRIAAVGRDFIAVTGRNGRTTFVPLGAIAAVRTQPGTREAVVAGERAAPLQASLAAIVSELAAERVRVHVSSARHSVVGELRASGDDVLVVFADGTATVPVYVPIAAVTELAVIDLL